MRELTHRSKNLLAVVQAMARKTASAAPDTETVVRDFSSRLRAIAAAHDLLVAESWSGADLRGLLAASLSQSIDPDGPGVRVEGPDLKLAPDAAQMLALAFHELTMNAVKHGSLTEPGGRIVIDWHRDGDEVRLRWREEGGPPVAPPERSGFGRRRQDLCGHESKVVFGCARRVVAGEEAELVARVEHEVHPPAALLGR